MSLNWKLPNRSVPTLITASMIAIYGCSSSTSPTMASSTVAGQVSVVGDRIQRDGKPWVPHGFFQVAYQASPSEQGVPAFETQAQKYYTPQEYTDMANAGADSVRVMLGQTVGDSENTTYYSQALVKQFIGAVQAARKAGLTVIVGVQDESITQDQNETILPNDATRRVWTQLVPAFKDDKGILLELFNEPGTGPTQQPSASDWQDWASAMNMTIEFVRSKGATNVVVADGLAHAGTLTGAPALTDMDSQVAYASHPYTFNANEEDPKNAIAFLDTSFGNFGVSHPVIITEWGQGYYCGPTNPVFLITFLNYIQSKGVGLEMSFWDWGGPTAFRGTQYNYPNSDTSLYYSNGALVPCFTGGVVTPSRGPGLTINSWYKTGVIPSQAL